MISTVGMVVTIVIIIAAAIGGVWYWTKIKRINPRSRLKIIGMQDSGADSSNDDAFAETISHIKFLQRSLKKDAGGRASS